MNNKELRQFLRDRGVYISPSRIYPKLTKNQKNRLQKLYFLLYEKNQAHSPIVSKINRWGILYRFNWRIHHSFIPNPDKCIEMIEKKLIRRL
jgi:hypothetical protein